MFEYNCTVLKVVDGDTVDVDIDLGFDVHFKQRIRLARINSPEIKTEEGKTAKSFVQQFQGASAVVKTSKTDRYGRYIGELTIDWQESPKNLSDLIVEQNNAVYIKY